MVIRCFIACFYADDNGNGPLGGSAEYRTTLRSAAGSAELVFADEDPKTDFISNKVLDQIKSCSGAFCDFTPRRRKLSDSNVIVSVSENVLIEYGMAQALGIPVRLVRRTGLDLARNEYTFPSDVSGLAYRPYTSGAQLKNELAAFLADLRR